MAHESVTVAKPCARCHSPDARTHYSLSDAPGKVRFSAGFHCEACGAASEADHIGVPEELRPLFYRENGRWVLRVVDPGPHRVEVLRKLRGELHLDLAQAGELARRIPGDVAEGTRVEMEAMLKVISSTGARAEVVRAL